MGSDCVHKKKKGGGRLRREKSVRPSEIEQIIWGRGKCVKKEEWQDVGEGKFWFWLCWELEWKENEKTQTLGLTAYGEKGGRYI